MTVLKTEFTLVSQYFYLMCKILYILCDILNIENKLCEEISLRTEEEERY
ncbi:hypothetical protein HMPREF1866_00673 [Lachnoanaerobaculum saburreum]|uniref:Uncharacterized protein n=1 Tax=Lachnoanaerobaculum saburreum TaxID=467210 RepID=A0A133ZXU3_9FIRM|nr:hypothetical protein HMPREF1866_00673 [Lachnoanaerobaculum saburreum]